ncbi:MAG: SGNH/GDSL hydrolase family protein [Allosphingosinicella sp.]|uniref:SGNH/GDSL hydrolase family protein n=1 Tax=Allosphingosinicella sp. TaxID=2823234 RepID=UPI0039294022
MPHLVLLGDSIFDNARYVPGEPDVVRQVRAALPKGWTASLEAVDGATTRNVPSQTARLPKDATHLVVSMGGNDALGTSHILYENVRQVAEAVLRLRDAQERFATDYHAALDAVLARGLPTAVCTIYDTPQTRTEQPIIRTALSVFNDVISRAAFSQGLPLIDLRLICNEDADYANPIEPSARGGEKMARAIARLVASEWQMQVVV